MAETRDPKNPILQPRPGEPLGPTPRSRWISALAWVLVLAIVLIVIRLVRGW